MGGELVVVPAGDEPPEPEPEPEPGAPVPRGELVVAKVAVPLE